MSCFYALGSIPSGVRRVKKLEEKEFANIKLKRHRVLHLGIFFGFIALVELWDTMNNFAYVLLFLCERKKGEHIELNQGFTNPTCICLSNTNTVK